MRTTSCGDSLIVDFIAAFTQLKSDVHTILNSIIYIRKADEKDCEDNAAKDCYLTQ